MLEAASKQISTAVLQLSSLSCPDIFPFPPIAAVGLIFDMGCLDLCIGLMGLGWRIALGRVSFEVWSKCCAVPDGTDRSPRRGWIGRNLHSVNVHQACA